VIQRLIVGEDRQVAHVLVVRVRRHRLGFGRGARVWGSAWGGEAAHGGDVGSATPCYECRGHAGGPECCRGKRGVGRGREARPDYEDEGREGAR
jgi:hypothetical protein